MKNKRAIMVAVSALALASAVPSEGFAQVIINCTQNFNPGNYVKCTGGRVVVNPNATTQSVVGCGAVTNTPLPAKCIIQTGGIAVTKNVKVDFPTASFMLTRAADVLLIDRLRMSYTGAPTPATTIMLTPAQVSGGVTVKVGGRVNLVGGETLGIYGGNITIRADTI